VFWSESTSRAAAWPTKPPAAGVARPSLDRPSPLMWECAAVLDERSCVLFTSLTGTVAILVVADAQSQLGPSNRFLNTGLVCVVEVMMAVMAGRVCCLGNFQLEVLGIAVRAGTLARFTSRALSPARIPTSASTHSNRAVAVPGQSLRSMVYLQAVGLSPHSQEYGLVLHFRLRPSLLLYSSRLSAAVTQC
jgi:hypothetical protein